MNHKLKQFCDKHDVFPYGVLYYTPKSGPSWSPPETENGVLITISREGNYNALVEFLYTFRNYDVHFENDMAFRLCCSRGHIKLAQYLYLLYGEKININAHNDYAFLNACRMNHRKIADWLLLLPNNKINIHALNDYALKWATRKNNIKIIQLLDKLTKDGY